MMDNADKSAFPADSQLDLVPRLAPRLEPLPRQKIQYHRPGPYWVRPHSKRDQNGVVRLVQGYWCYGKAPAKAAPAPPECPEGD
jgi:hypothetical protein